MCEPITVAGRGRPSLIAHPAFNERSLTPARSSMPHRRACGCRRSFPRRSCASAAGRYTPRAPRLALSATRRLAGQRLSVGAVCLPEDELPLLMPQRHIRLVMRAPVLETRVQDIGREFFLLLALDPQRSMFAIRLGFRRQPRLVIPRLLTCQYDRPGGVFGTVSSSSVMVKFRSLRSR